jgi:hypothetical protein
MNFIIKKRMEIIEALFESAEFDYEEISTFILEKELFNDREKSRIINSFIFNISKIQDNLGAKFSRSHRPRW